MTEQVLRPVEIRSSAEPWTTINLTDGTKIRVRLNITEVAEVVVDGEQVKDGGGQLVYSIKWATAIHVVPPEVRDGKPN